MTRIFRADEKGLRHEKFKIDGKEYDLTALSEDEYQIYNSLCIVQSELIRLQNKSQITKTARQFHAGLLKDLIAPKNA